MLLDGAEVHGAERLISEGLGFLGTADIPVNNAATAARTSFLDMGEYEYDRTLAVNLRFPFFALQSFARALVARGAAGSIINISIYQRF